jgi:hypothetical protein
MTDQAASRFEIGVEPRFPLDVLRSLRNEVNALLAGCGKISFGERFLYTSSNDEESDEL